MKKFITKITILLTLASPFSAMGAFRCAWYFNPETNTSEYKCYYVEEGSPSCAWRTDEDGNRVYVCQ